MKGFTYRSITIVTVILLIALASSYILSNLRVDGYTIDEVMSAYEAGQFRVIRTNSTNLLMSSDGTYVSAVGDGLYRLSDGMFFEQFDNAFFSPNGQYLVQAKDGIYRLSDLQKIVPVKQEKIIIANGEHAVFTGDIIFSMNGEYVSISGAGRYREDAESLSTEGYGVYRLSDGQQIVKSDSYSIYFSPDSFYASTDEGIFQLSDGQKLFEQHHFSPDSQYIYSINTGMMRLSDGEKLFDVSGEVYFTPDMAYVIISEDGVYRLSDGERLYNIEPIQMFSHPIFSSNLEYMAIRVDDGDNPFGGY